MERNKPTSFKEALYFFESVEQELNLPEWELHGVYVWKLVRFRVFQQYIQTLHLVEEAHPELTRLKKSRMTRLFQLVALFLFRNPFFSNARGVTRVVIPHARKRMISGELVDMYSYRCFTGGLRQSSLVLDRTTPFDPRPADGQPSYSVVHDLGLVLSRFIVLNLAKADRDIIGAVSTRLDLDEASVKKEIAKAVKSFKSTRWLFSCLFRKVRARYLYVVVSYGLEAAISAAQKKGIHVSEFQHGALGRGHIGYDFPGWRRVPYFPDNMLAFGPDWFTDAHFPENCKVVPVGSVYIEESARRAHTDSKVDGKRMLVLSQGPVARQLMVQIGVFMSLRPDWDITIRPHPSESVQTVRKLLRDGASEVDREITVGNREPLTEQFAKVDMVVGVNSTAIAEAMLADCRVAVFVLNNASNYYSALQHDHSEALVHSGHELADRIDSIGKIDARGYFAPPVIDPVSMVEGNGAGRHVSGEN